MVECEAFLGFAPTAPADPRPSPMPDPAAVATAAPGPEASSPSPAPVPPAAHDGLHGRRRVEALVAILLAVALATLDTAIANTALPTIADGST